MLILWDEPKRAANLDKHGLDFADLDEAFFDDALKGDTHSGRLVAIGSLHEGIVTTVYAELGEEAVSIISLRPASRKERRAYVQSL